jgi:NADH dehydrogenase
MVRDYRSIDPREARIILVEGTPHVLPTYPESLRTKARRQLEALGVTVITQGIVEDVGPGSVRMRTGEQSQTIHAETVLWAAGVKASAFGEVLARRTGAQLDRAGKVIVSPDLSLTDHPEIFVTGDLAHVRQPDGQPVPGVAQGAIQQGRYVARLLMRRARGKPIKPFRYWDLGSMAVIGRNKAVGDLGLIKVSGISAWFLWVAVHIWALIDPEQRINVMFHWVWKYFTHKTGSRLVTGDPPNTREVMQSNGRQ